MIMIVSRLAGPGYSSKKRDKICKKLQMGGHSFSPNYCMCTYTRSGLQGLGLQGLSIDRSLLPSAAHKYYTYT